MAAVWGKTSAPKGPVFDSVKVVGGAVWERALPALDAADPVLDAARKMNQKTYAVYVVVNGKIESGWDFNEDAKEHKAESLPEKFKATAKIVRKGGMKALGIDPDDNASWMTTADMDAVAEGDGKEKEGDDEDDDTDPEKEWSETPDEEPKDGEEKVLDGDFVGHPFRGNGYRKASRESGAAVNTSIRAKRAEKSGDAKATKTAHKAAHHAHAAAALTADTKKAKSYHAKMATFHGSRAGGALDSADAGIPNGDGIALDEDDSAADVSDSQPGLFDSAAALDAANDYPIYHKTFSAAVQAAAAYAEKKGFAVDDEDWDHKVAMGPRKPDEGKTNSYSVALTKDGKAKKKALQIQVYGRGEQGYELNCYVS
jgi:hypothetical protein